MKQIVLSVNNRRNIVVVVMVLILVLIVGFTIVYFNKPKKVQVTTEVSKVELQTKAAKLALDWLDTTRDSSDSAYFIDAFCNGESCPDYTLGSKSWREEPYLIWGRYEYYKKTKDIKQLEILESDLNYLSKKPMQLNRWGCRLVKDLVLEGILSSENKVKAQTICFIGAYEGKEDFAMYTDDQSLDAMIKIMTDNDLSLGKFDSVEMKRDFVRNTFVSSDYSAIFNAKIYMDLTFADGQKIPILNVVKNNFLKAMYGYSLLNKDERTMYNNSILGIASLDLYHLTNIEQYLKFALNLEQRNNSIDNKDLEGLVYHAFFMKELSKVGGYENYKTKLGNDIDLLVNNYFDGVGYGGNKFDRGAFYDSTKTQYSSVLNGLIIGLIMSQ